VSVVFGTEFLTCWEQYFFNFGHCLTVTFGTAFMPSSAMRFYHFQPRRNFANNTGGIRHVCWELYKIFKLERGGRLD